MYGQHQSGYHAFFSIRKTYPQQSETNANVHFFSKEGIEGLQTSTRYYKNRSGEWLPLTGVFLDSFNDATIKKVSVQEAREVESGGAKIKIPKQIIIDLKSPVEGQVDRIQFAADSKWGNDFLRKAPNLRVPGKVTIQPYSFIPEGKERAMEGLSIKQDEEKLKDHYLEFKNVDGKNKPFNINGVEQFDAFDNAAHPGAHGGDDRPDAQVQAVACQAIG